MINGISICHNIAVYIFHQKLFTTEKYKLWHQHLHFYTLAFIYLIIHLPTSLHTLFRIESKFLQYTTHLSRG